MNRWIWLLALPWVVTQTTWTWVQHDCKPDSKQRYEVRYKGMYTGINCCPEAKEACEDQAEALNMAHERRKLEEITSGTSNIHLEKEF